MADRLPSPRQEADTRASSNLQYGLSFWIFVVEATHHSGSAEECERDLRRALPHLPPSISTTSHPAFFT